MASKIELKEMPNTNKKNIRLGFLSETPLIYLGKIQYKIYTNRRHLMPVLL